MRENSKEEKPNKQITTQMQQNIKTREYAGVGWLASHTKPRSRMQTHRLSFSFTLTLTLADITTTASASTSTAAAAALVLWLKFFLIFLHYFSVQCFLHVR